MTTTAVGIVAHPSRRAMADALVRTASADLIAYDHDGVGEQANHQAALEQLVELDADWLVWLEDDAVPCPSFRVRLAAVLADARPGIVSLYLGTGRWAGTAYRSHARVVQGLVEDAERDGARWITAGALWHAVAVAVPRSHAVALLTHLRGTQRPTDEGVTSYCRRTRTPVHYAWPSLVDHLDGPTVTAHPDGQPRTQTRRAWKVYDDGLGDQRPSVPPAPGLAGHT